MQNDILKHMAKIIIFIFDIRSYNGRGTFIQHLVFLYTMYYCKNEYVNVYKND